MAKKIFWGLIGVLIFAYAGYLLFSPAKQVQEVKMIHPNGEVFIGSAACENCHSEIYHSFANTPHYLTSRPALQEFIKGTFEPPDNVYYYNPLDKMVMVSTDSGFYQVGSTNGQPRGSQRFDMVIGSGTKGQSYLHWIENKLVQLPVSFHALDSKWCSSPGYPPDRFLINRPITGQCLDCHSTYVKVNSKLRQADAFDRNQIIYGIDCERCHGPAARHVEFHTTYTREKKGKFIINASLLGRKQQLDACGQCHSSIRKSPKAPFSFVPGDTLVENYMSLDRGDTTSQAEVHGNQFGLLTLSKCYLKSDDLTCSSCHDPHQKERGNLVAFSGRCMNCHNGAKQHLCKMGPQLGKAIEANCIDCHMPVYSSSKITFRVAGDKQLTPEKVRTHYIKVYPEIAKAIASEMAKLVKQ